MVDVANEIDLVQAARWCLGQEQGACDVLVNCAGISPKGNGGPISLPEMSTEQWKRVHRVNLTAPFILCRELIPPMADPSPSWSRMNPFLYETLSYDPSALVPVAMVNQFPLVMVASQTVPANAVSEFVDYARQQPGKLNFASAALGSSTHLAGELFNTKTGVKLLHVPYGGSMPALTALPLIQGGKVKALAVASEQRLASLPDVPTVIESGYPEFGTVTAWQGIFAPPGTPADAVQTLRAAVGSAMVDPENQKTLEAKGGIFLPPEATGEASAKFLADERQKWGPLIKSLYIRLEQ